MAKRYKKKSYKKRVSRKRKAPRNSVKAVVYRAIRRSIETKYKDIVSPTIAVYNTITDANVFSICPAVVQGITQSTRNGNRINPVSFKLKINLTCLDAKNILASPSPTYFDIYIFKFKGSNQEGGPPNAADMTFFLQDDNSAVPYAGISTDGLRPINSDMFTLCYHKRIVLSNMSSATATAGFYQTYNPNRCLSFNLTKHIKKTWMYDDNSALVTNDNLLLAIGATQTDGVSLGASQIGKYECLGWLAYKDA